MVASLHRILEIVTLHWGNWKQVPFHTRFVVLLFCDYLLCSSFIIYFCHNCIIKDMHSCKKPCFRHQNGMVLSMLNNLISSTSGYIRWIRFLPLCLILDPPLSISPWITASLYVVNLLLYMNYLVIIYELSSYQKLKTKCNQYGTIWSHMPWFINFNWINLNKRIALIPPIPLILCHQQQ